MNVARFKDRWDRTLAIVAFAVGIVILVLGWFGVSGSSLTTEQIPYLASGAVGGLFAMGAAATLWLSADLYDEFVKLDEIHELLLSERDLAAPAPDPIPEGVSENGPRPARSPRRPLRNESRALS